ncbi:serine/arginine repetitive matrix protein 1-like [Plakobranchus ocellatus]|uniref:Serine/arginine repetitive matrix protein 1-like n=1 Tax=Plakobranchus ocellatus TaxID=259542 RepID=A0AAV4BMU3_9GAST|nr:serine/arginine repetitive matrix protein 1-like [Plakobranchus ocellatus]
MAQCETAEDDGPVAVPWLHDRLAISSRSCRFELPMDFRDFENMSVREYLLKYCKVPRHRQSRYKRLFDRHKSRTTGVLSIQEMESCLLTILLDSVELPDLKALLRCLKIDSDTVVDLRLFSVICAVAERILYNNYLGSYESRPGVSRGFLESADFCNLEWKLRGVNIDPYFRRLLTSLG